MEKRTMTFRNLLFIAAGLTVIVCMFLNWIPVNLDVGMIQIDNAFGKINAVNFRMRLSEIENSLGAWASVLPESFESIKSGTTLLAVVAVLTIIAYTSAIVLNILKKEKFVEIISGVSSIGAIGTSYFFCSLISNIVDLLGIAAAGHSALTNVKYGPCGIVMLAGVISICCTDIVAEVIVQAIAACISAVVRFVSAVVNWVELIVSNLGYVASDAVGGFAGVVAGRWLLSVSGSTTIAVIAGLVIAGVVALGCMIIVHRVFMNDKESIFK